MPRLEEISLCAYTKELLDEIYNDDEYRHILIKSPLSVVYGDYTACLGEVLSSVAPYSKVAFIATQPFYLQFAKKLFDLIKGVQSVPLGLVVEDKAVYSIEDLSKPFALPCDVRAVVTIEPSLSGYASYFAGLRGIAHVCVATTPDIYGYLTRFVFCSDGEKLNRFGTNVARTLIIDNHAASKEVSEETKLNLASYLPALYDYRLYLIKAGYSGAKRGYALIKECVKRVYSKKDITSTDAIICGLKGEIGNFLANGEVVDNSAYAQYKMLSKVLGYDSTTAKVVGLERILRLYSLTYDKKLETDRAVVNSITSLCFDLDISEGDIYRERLEFVSGFNGAKDKVEKTLNKIKAENLANEKVTNTFLSGSKEKLKIGKPDKTINELINKTCFFPFGFNITRLVNGRVGDYNERKH